MIALLQPAEIVAESEKNTLKIAVLYDDQFLLHNTGLNHPENPSRITHAIDFLKKEYQFKSHLIWPSFDYAPIDLISLVHSEKYINLVKLESERLNKSVATLSTGDTVISDKSYQVARKSVGAMIEGIDQIMQGKVSSAFAFTRPPGHHASRDKGMGFCVFNNVAIAAKYLQNKYGIKRILIVDFDVHHGNGTQDIFYSDNSVFYFSIHQHPFYPGTGRQTERGIGNGYGFTLNIDLPKGAGDREFIEGLNNQLIPAMDKFKPEFILVSAGFDAHENDLLGQLKYSNDGYKKAADILLSLAKKYSMNRMMFVLEGGYEPTNIKDASESILNAMISKHNN
ncbi:histone deacetylase [Candidatus Methylopumilus rimovensis]|uniref:Histone deacetylase n=1 Tax=Candidatus Methylopumilus rimovensis TaxID=2588535 RepID=A0AAF1D7V8_9PROT|nr:histone deacetylase [Candidatus Methylopumilus rimovensis]QDD14160.1 histone deacetylase [Candidatus Methylopumilus rimovensis]